MGPGSVNEVAGVVGHGAEKGWGSGQRAWLEWGVRDWRERQFLMVPSPGAGFPLVLPSQ